VKRKDPDILICPFDDREFPTEILALLHLSNEHPGWIHWTNKEIDREYDRFHPPVRRTAEIVIEVEKPSRRSRGA
jgi:hypothetical protein